MRKKVNFKHLLYIVLFAFYSCVSTEYLMTVDDLDKFKYEGNMSGYTAHADNGTMHTTYYSTSNTLKPIYISKAKLEKIGLHNYDMFLYYCNERKFNNAYQIVEENSEIDIQNKEFLRSIILFLQFRYTESLSKLNSNNNDFFKQEIELLKLDNEFEIQRKNYNLNKQYFIDEYQRIFDSEDTPSEYKQVIENRIKYIRYIK